MEEVIQPNGVEWLVTRRTGKRELKEWISDPLVKPLRTILEVINYSFSVTDLPLIVMSCLTYQQTA